MGHALIINNVATQYAGSKEDANALINAYEKMKFTVHHHEDCDDAVSSRERYYIFDVTLTLYIGFKFDIDQNCQLT